MKILDEISRKPIQPNDTRGFAGYEIDGLIRQPQSMAERDLLILSGHYDRDPGVDQYIMVLLGNGKQLNEWTCTSSHANGQQKGDQNIRGGLIPPVHHCRNLDHYDVIVKPEDSSHVKGVEGAFFRIKPDLVMTKSGTQRGYFGVHRDANVPGSLGCPVMDARNFADFKDTMHNLLKTENIDSIPFFPLYS